MDTYTASNGYRVNHRGNGAWVGVQNLAGDEAHSLGLYTVEALREFFRAEEDERLGRFRFIDDDGDVSLVYPDPFDENRFTVTVERSGQSVTLGRNQPAHEDWRKPLDAYFAAHPVPRPAWHEAATGEIWELKLAVGAVAAQYLVDDGRFFRLPLLAPVDPGWKPAAFASDFVDGRRLHPSEEGS